MASIIIVAGHKALVGTLGSFFKSRNELILENLALRQQLAIFHEQKKRPKIEPIDKLLWVCLRRIWKRWSSALLIVTPETVVRWHREGFRRYWRLISSARRGRPRTDEEIRDLIRRMARENPTWRAPRIHGELLKLGYNVCERTVSRYLPRREPSEDKIARWKAFLRNQRSGIAAMDLFTVPTAAFKVLYVLFIIRHARREMLHAAVTARPAAQWIIQQLRNAFPYDSVSRYLIFDRDSSFSRIVVEAVKSLGAKPVRISYRSPWQNGVCERWIGSCRRELLDHVVVLGEAHLVRLLRDYVSYYNNDRCHCTLTKDAPSGRAVGKKPARSAKVVGLERVGGIHHRYEWKAAA